MRLLHVVPTWWPAMRYGGTIVSTRGLARALVRSGDDVQVVTTPVDGDGNSDVPTDADVVDDGVRIRYCRSDFIRRLYWSPQMLRELRSRVGSVDIVHTHGCYSLPSTIGARIAKRSGTSVVVSPRGMLVRELIAARSAILKRVWIALFERTNLRFANLVHVTSDLERDAIVDLMGLRTAPIVVVPNGVDMPENPLPQGATRTVLYLGRLNWKKNIELLVRAVARVPGARLIVAGPDEDGTAAGLFKVAKELHCSDRIALVGEVARSAAMELIEKCDVLALASSNENFGNVVVEAMAAARPVVATQGVGAAAQLMACGGGLVVDGTVEALATAIARLLDAPAEAAAMGAAGRRHVAANLSWDAVAARMRALYAEVAGGAS